MVILNEACEKSRRDDRLQTGANAPDNDTTKEQTLKGRQRHQEVDIESFYILCRPIRAFAVCRTLNGGFTPACSLSHL